MPEIKEIKWPEDENKRECLGDCDWCSYPVYADQLYVDGKDGDGMMHTWCENLELGYDD